MAFQIKKFNSILASMINWVSGATDKITDFNVGSVIRTLLEAIAMELEELYYQLLKAVEEAIEEAIYRAFNFPRNPAVKATGLVTFYRSPGSDVAIIIPRGSLVSTSSSPPVSFEVQSESRLPVISGNAISGSVSSLVANRDFANDLGLDPSYVSFPSIRILDLNNNGESDTLLSITTTNIPNDTLNFTPLSGSGNFEVTFQKVYFDDGVTQTDYRSQAAYLDSVYFPVGLVVGNYLYFGATKQFHGVDFYLGATTDIQAVVATLIGEYWNGAQWKPLPYFTDGTKGINIPFSTDGTISWQLPTDWVRSTYPVGGSNLFWVRIKSDTTLTSTAKGDCANMFGNAYKIIIMEADVDVQAIVAGIGGNVSANSVTQLSSSIPNIFATANPTSFSSGKEEETDLERKTRFALYIQSLARATRGALEYAARTVNQVVAAKAIDDVRATVLKYKDGTPSIWVDITESMRNPGDAPVKLFETSTVDDDALYIGASELFNYINMHLVTNGVIYSNDLVWEYRGIDSGSGELVWKTLAVTDGTDPGGTPGPLQQSGTISFTPPDDWVADSFPIAGESSFSYQLLWIRLRITADGVIYTTPPTGDWCSLPPGFGYVILYCHDGSGGLNDNLKASVENVVELYRGCGIIVVVTAPYKIQPPLTCSLLVASNYDADDIAGKVKQALIDYLNTKILGEDLYLAELYQFVMDKYDKAILNTTITAPVKDIIVPSSGVLRADPATVTVTATTV